MEHKHDYGLSGMAHEKKHAAKHKSHPYRRTVIDHHHDGSHTVTHEREDGSTDSPSYAVTDLDGVHDGLESNVGEPNPGEAEAEAAGAAGNPVE